MNNDRFLTAAAIARELGVGRAAVANWRRRHDDFPPPVEDGSTTTRFSWSAVQQWLHDTGRAAQLAESGRTSTGTHLLPPAAASEPERDLTSVPIREWFARVVVSLLPDLGEDGDLDNGRPVLLDPACGSGALLRAAAERFGHHVRLAGQGHEAPTEPAPTPEGFGVDVDLRPGDALAQDAFQDLRSAAAVVCVPPPEMRAWPAHELADDPRWRYGLPDPGDPELAWVQHCLAHLHRRGVAVVAVTSVAAARPSGRGVRAALVRAGVLRAVVALPPRLTVSGEGAANLWVLGAPRTSEGVRMVDLTGLPDLRDAPSEPAAWAPVFDDPALARLVPAVDLLDDDVALTPTRYVVSRSGDTVADLSAVAGRLAGLYAKVGAALATHPTAAGPPRVREVTLAELERAQAVRILPRDATPRAGDVLFRTMGREPVVATGTRADERGVAQVVGVDPERIDPGFLALFVRRDALAAPVANTLGAATREDVRRCRIPRLPISEQRPYGDAYRRLRELDDVARRLAGATSALIDQTLHGLTTS